MSLTLEATQPLPLALGEDGIIRVGGTRVTLDTVAEAFQQGATPEEIQQQYPTLSLADIYSAISYILRHSEKVAEYLEIRTKQHLAVKKENTVRFNTSGLRQRLLSRRNRQ